MNDSFINQTPRTQKMIMNSWCKDFSDIVFPAISEERFSVLYSDSKNSRPNTPINIIIGALILKESNGLNDDELLESICCDVRYQYALHTTHLEEQPVSDRTFSRFRARLYDYERESGENLLNDEFLRFVKQDSHFSKYYDGIFILFKTGLRISEFCGLTIEDIDFDNGSMQVERQLQRKRNMEYIIEEPKTHCGIRQVPLDKKVLKAFKRIIKNRKVPKKEPVVSGMSGFLFLDKNHMPMVALHWEKYFQHINQKYNKIYKVQMPKVTPRVCRHTFCSNQAKSGMNPKSLQYIMGHSDIGVTLNTYTHFGFEDAKKEMLRLKEA